MRPIPGVGSSLRRSSAPASLSPKRFGRRHHAELIAFGVCHNYPRRLTLADVDAPGSELREPVDFITLTPVGWSDIDVHSVLPDLVLGYFHECQGRSLRGSDEHLLRRLRPR